MSSPPAHALPAPLPTAAEAARYAAESLSAATRRAYRADWADFAAWCRQHGHPALPAAPEAIAAYLAALATTHGRSALRRRLAAIGGAHALAGHPWNPGHPAIRHTLRGILRRHGTPARQAAALTTAEIRRLLAGCDRGLAGTRDRALLLLGFAGALRRSELVAIEREHVTVTPEGLRLLLPRSKGDAAGEGATIGIARGRRPETCPVRALEAWLQMSDCRFGPVFRKVDRWGTVESRALTPEAVGHILKRRAAAAGLTVGALERLSAHGLRAGFVTEAYQAGARDEQIMAHTRHRDLKTMRGYVRRAKLLTESPVRLLGL
ncbi:site-specific integrase [Roseicella aerolata]|uniref:Site-specific integrase n=1 Tax=Roseicella aerolata TaxID=2883479 RepID=A0A9X1IIA3_9PROT|nr:site-specific integrase [Roseicella aerolata]MCB4825381.1 site-specific integrase [Roseicella aerolata]